jgi:allophanate hydrolase subunit 1
MADLGQLIRETQREAAALDTAALRHEIEMNLHVQDAAICQFNKVTRPGGGTVEDLIVATGTVMISFAMTALYVRELATRPRDTWTVTASVN